MKRGQRFAMAAAACAGGLIVAGSAQAIVIDNFNSGSGMVSSAIPGPVNFGTAAGDALANSRTLEIIGFPTNADPLSMGAELEVAAPPGRLGHSQDAFAPGGRSRVLWDANGGGLGGLDLTDGGASNAIKMDLISIDVGNVGVELFVEDTGGTVSSLVLPGLAPGTNEFLFTDFVGGADFSMVESVMMEITASTTSDAVFDLIETNDVPPPPGPRGEVPEPVTATLGLMGLGALAHATRRR